ncbi:hypothetical protein BCT30_18815 [Enterovibrio norvegicus]|uniref:hypothetical protein n=1 Tax=Enterovibrio norvegicus TaxID=188144 RepID=UPI000C82084C|nr:hypothetical protein [Enterovibrio norvegicus]MCC4798510.1 hypothetical protein [Enterovibrio norvegicus]PMI33802.1 hypothetical protein BCU47_08300 [Enterovibrio norvegicus]PMI39108.1 hypothetical protein BCU46_06640 [Enterovibrio norvegicus]PMN49563.1 hypothetical protein BCT30_18815 [Enterovibrio norvegicus]TKF19583.1 hypothetical protein FCV66_01685 [Enterovibrio norvegicus]
MKILLMVSAIFSVSAMAKDHHEVMVFDERVSVEVSTQNSTAIDEEQYWTMLEDKGWKTAQEATSDLEVSEALRDEISYRASLDSLSSMINAGKHTQASSLVEENPDWMHCDRIQWMWLDLKNESKTGYGANAKAKYQKILDNCGAHELSTTQKLLGWTAPSAAQDILSRYEQSTAYDPQVVAQIKQDMALGKLSKASLSEGELAHVGELVIAKKNAKAAEAIGWKYLNMGDAFAANDWFERAISWAGPSAKRIEGRLLTLQEMGEREELLMQQAQWSDSYPSIAELDFGSDDGNVVNCEGEIKACLESLNAIESLSASEYALKGWTLYDLNRPVSAATEFENALDLMAPNDPDWDLTQYGYVLALDKMGFSDKATVLSAQINDIDTRAELDKQIAMKRVFKAFDTKAYETTLAQIEEYEAVYGKDVQLIEIKAWSLFNSNRKREALKEYRKLADAFPHNEDYQESFQAIKCGVSSKSMKCRS